MPLEYFQAALAGRRDKLRRQLVAGQAGIGKTLVSSCLIDRVASGVGRPLVEVPVGFKWFVPGLRFMAERSGATIVEVDASHVAMISQPQAVTDVILGALESVG